MAGFERILFTVALTLMGLMTISSARAETLADASSGLTVQVSDGGDYSVSQKDPAWSFGGKIGSPVHDIASAGGHDRIGDYREITFAWNASSPMSGSIRLYSGKGTLLLSQTSHQPLSAPPDPFPNLTTIPAALHTFSFQGIGGHPVFKLSQEGTPWLFFDDQANAMIISPASNFMTTTLSGDGVTSIVSGFNKGLANLPSGFTQSTVVVFAKGINHAWDVWGSAITSLQDRKTPANDADVFLKYLGYWTDNGAAYYHHFEKDKGYEGTLVALLDHYKQLDIPIHYLQLDSWWYKKGKTLTKQQADAVVGGDHNYSGAAYGGLLEYTPMSDVFPDGLAGFESKIGLPFMTHNRWISPESPYRAKYRISGLAPVDPQWWNDIISSIASSGVTAYEQDWLDMMYEKSPELSQTVDTGVEFCDNMASACQAHGMSMQYCMAPARFFLQGAKYDNLTTIRVSGDRFEWAHWHHFLFGSRLPRSLGIWPWSDVFMSWETDNFLLSTLSAGPVGTGDKIGDEYLPNIALAVRKDGVIVKPDLPIVMNDAAYINEANAAPNSPLALVARTWTDHGSIRTLYFFSYAPLAGQREVRFTPADEGVPGATCVFNYFSGTVVLLKPGETFHDQIPPTAGFAYYVVAPMTGAGIALFGDAGKFVPTGKKRLSVLAEDGGSLVATLLFGKGEDQITLRGYASVEPKISAQVGKVQNLKYDPATHLFTAEITPSNAVTMDGPDPIRKAQLSLSAVQ